jgi:hypothetical protein
MPTRGILHQALLSASFRCLRDTTPRLISINLPQTIVKKRLTIKIENRDFWKEFGLFMWILWSGC